MCGSSQPAPQPKAPDNNYWSWWNFQDSKENLGGSYRLNELAIGDILQTSKGTSNLKNIATGNTRDTKGTTTAPKVGATSNRLRIPDSSAKKVSNMSRTEVNRLRGTISTGRRD